MDTRDLARELNEAMVRTGYQTNDRALKSRWLRKLMSRVDLDRAEPIERAVYAVTGVIVIATDRRVLRLEATGFLASGVNVAELPYELLATASYSIGSVSSWGSLAIPGIGGGPGVYVDNVWKGALPPMVDYLQARLGARGARPGPAVGSHAGSLTSDLDRLAALRERGLLTDEEFAAAKQRLLG